MGRMNRIEIESWPLEAGGVTIRYNDQVAANGLNVVSAFMVLGGLLAGNPCEVTMVMEERGNFGSFTWINYERGRDVVAAFERAAEELPAKSANTRKARRTKK